MGVPNSKLTGATASSISSSVGGGKVVAGSTIGTESLIFRLFVFS